MSGMHEMSETSSPAPPSPGGRIAVTGVGVVAPAGVGREVFWSSLLADEIALSATPASRFGAPVPAQALTLAGRGFEPGDHADPRIVRRISALSSMALIAAQSAFDQAESAARPTQCPEWLERGSVVLGTSFGSSVYHFDYYEGIFEHGLKEASPLLFSECVQNAASGHITHQLGLRGPGLTLVGGEDAGLQALLTAIDLVRAQHASFAVAGAAEEYCDLVHASSHAAGSTGDDAPLPLAQDSPLPAYGEGAGFFVLEPESDANARGAKILAHVLGIASGRQRPGEDPAVAVTRATEEALAMAQLAPADITFVVSGADGGSLDRIEVDGLAGVLDVGAPLLFSAPKRWVGEAFAFSSMAEAVVALEALQSGRLPPHPHIPADRTRLRGRWRLAGPGDTVPDGPGLVVAATRNGGATVVVMAQ